MQMNDLLSFKVSRLSFGAGPLASTYTKDLNDESALTTVRRALELGINFFDTSPYYGATKSEQRLGKALKILQSEGYARESYHLCSKVGRYGLHKKDFDFSGERVRQSVTESLQRLQTTYLDIVLAHDIEFGDLDMIVNETIPTLRDLQKEGKVKYVGVSGYPLPVLLKCSEMVPLDLVLSYCHYNLHNTMLKDFEPKFKAAGVKGLIAASPLSMGLFTEEGPPSWHPAPQALKDASRNIAKLCKDASEDISKVALQFALQFDAVNTTLTGFSSAEEVEKAVTWCNQDDNVVKSKPKLISEIYEVLRPFHNLTWQSPPNE